MTHTKDEFLVFPADAGRVIANLETAYDQWLDARVQLKHLPVAMFWKTVAGLEYLAVKDTSHSSGITRGARTPDTERRLEQYQTEKAALNQRIAQADALISSRTAQYRALRLPVFPIAKSSSCAPWTSKGCCATESCLWERTLFAPTNFCAAPSSR